MVYCYPDETFFVEDYSQPSRTTQEYAKRSSSCRQDALATELSNQTRHAYANEIMQHLDQMQSMTLPDIASMDIQQEIRWFMRPFLLDFLVEAHAAYQLLPETLFLTINLLDRYCSRRVVYKRHYQLVGCAALLIAAKYGDRKERVPLIGELRKMCCKVYDKDMFTQMEWHVLNTLEWIIGHPTVDCFIRTDSQNRLNDDLPLEHMAWYLCELAYYHKEFVSKKPSTIAAASLALAKGILRRPDAIEIDSYEVHQTVFELSQKLDSATRVLRRKYASSHFSHVSIIVEKFLLEQEAINRRATHHPMSTGLPSTDKQLSNIPNYPGTPQKQYYRGNVVNGYMTPPITPEGEYFMNGTNPEGFPTSSQCPITPTPTAPHNSFPTCQYNHHQTES